MQNPVVLIDGSGYIFRAFYAVPPLTTKAGFPTNALFGFTKMLGKLLASCHAHEVAVVFDAGAKTFRNDLYADYKANRKECPPELKEQMPYFRSISKALGLPVLELAGYEADDLIATLTSRITHFGREVVIVSADKDLMQLVNDKVQIWDTMRDRRFDVNGVKEKFGVTPDKVVEILALTGDSSDNIPGLSGCGPTTALQLVEKFGTVENIINSIAQIRESKEVRNRVKLAATIELEVEMLRLSRRLVEVDSKVPLTLEVGGELVNGIEADEAQLNAGLKRRAHDTSALSQIAEKLEFSSLFAGFGSGAVPTESSNTKPYAAQVVYASDFDSFVTKLSAVSEFAFDTETTSLDFTEAKLVGASFCFNDEEAYYVPLAHLPETLAEGASQVTVERFTETIGKLLADQTKTKIGQNIKYDSNVLSQHGITLGGATFDTMVAAWLLNPDQGQYNLTALAVRYLSLPTIEFDTVLSGKECFAEVPVSSAVEYACQDAWYAWKLAKILREKLSVAELLPLSEEIEMPLVQVLASMEQAGITINGELFANMSEECRVEIAALEKEIYGFAGGEFNLNSPKQLGEILFVKLALPTKGLKKTKTGISTDSSVLEKLESVHPIAKALLKYRFLHKLKSTYLDALPKQVSAKTGRVHTRYNQTGAATGRLSSSDPNLQNIPLSSIGGKTIRSAFVAAPGKRVISADYSQIELRVLAHMSGDQNLINAFKQEIDIHAKTTREVYGLPADAEITSAQRREGKTINFGVVYGMGAYSLARDLEIPVPVAAKYIENYFARYPGVKQYFARLEHDSKTKGFVTTLLGRKRMIADLDMNGRDEGFRYRAAINAPIQGSAADLIKIAMIRLYEALKKFGSRATLLLQIHDELVIECDEDLVSEVSAIIREKMEQVIALSVPLVVDLGSGVDWEEAHR